MPTYQYRCASCSRELEVVQKFTDPTLTQCPSCHGQLRKVFSPVGVVFKGSGFYSTDSRGKKRTDAGTAGKPDTGTAKPDTKTTEASTPDAKPAAAAKPDAPTSGAPKADRPKLSTGTSAAA